MNKDRLKKLNKEQLIGLILDKDDIIDDFKKREKDVDYIGGLNIEGKFYNFYIDKEGEEV